MTSIPNHSKQQCSCDQNNLHLHLEIENLKQRLLERERHIVKMETNFLKEAEKFPNGEFVALTEELLTWQDKYSRLFEAHKRVQKVNQGLEDKLLKMVDKSETEKNSLQEDITLLSKKLMEQQAVISKLHEENERYRTDLNIAIQLLQCKPSNFIPQKFDMLPHELQVKVRSYVASKQRKLTDSNGNLQRPDVKTIKVPMPTYPPTAMVYSLDGEQKQNGDEEGSNQNAPPVDIVSAAIMARVLKEREKERSHKKHCHTCSCSVILLSNKSCQTEEIILSDLSSRQTSFENNSSDNEGDGAKISRNSIDDIVENDFLKKEHTAVELESPDLIDLNGYNSDDNYECFKNLRKTATTREDNRDLITFDSSATDTVRGPRPCSVRVQPGSNNILLDNAAQFSSPVLYKRRINVADVSEPIVHLAKSRASSISSSSNNSNLKLSSAETEI